MLVGIGSTIPKIANLPGPSRPGGGGGSPFEYTAIDNNFSMEFDGTNYITTGVDISGTDFTLSYWVNANGSYAGFQRFHPVSIRPSNNVTNQSLGYLYTKGAVLYPSYQAYDSGGTIYSVWSARDLDFISAGWHNIIWTYNNTTKEIYCYVDGTIQTFTSFDSLNTTNYLIGSLPDNLITFSTINIGATWLPSEFWNGIIDEVAVWNSVLSEPTIEAIYNTTNDNPGKVADLSETPEGVPVAWYRFE